MIENDTTIQQMIYLCGCVVNGIVPDVESITEMDLTTLYQFANRHMLAAMVAYALDSAGVHNLAFEKALAKAIHKMTIMDVEQQKVLTKLEETGIWYMPLKGAVLKDLYPSYGIRQMSDRDILVDAERMNDIKSVMNSLGYTTVQFGIHHHDSYVKPPVSNFELHRQLYDAREGKRVVRYYKNVKQRLLKDENNGFGWHFRPEDFYIYLISHEYKHYSFGGTGLRSLLDTYVYLKNMKLDFDYVAAETKKLGISEFEEANRKLALHLFSKEALSVAEQQMLARFTIAGTYGRPELFAENQLAAKGRIRYFLSRLTLPYSMMLDNYPVLKKVTILYPLCWMHRLFYGFFFKNKEFMHQLRIGLSRKGKNRGATNRR